MRALLDTHALLWWVAGDPSLSGKASGIIADTQNNILVSAASAWEIATKVRLGRLPTAEEFASNFVPFIQREGFELLPISAEHGIRAGLLPGTHNDPFDRMLIAQAQAEDVPLISKEALFDAYGVRRVW